MRKNLWTVVSFLVIFLFSFSAWAAAPAKKNIPTNITAERMDYSAEGQTVIFSGNVHVKRPDFELWAATLTVYLDKTNSPKEADTELGSMQTGDINKIVAEKNVRMKSNDKEGTCEKATYFAKTDTITMEGSPLLRDKDKSSISGKKIVHHIKNNRTEVQQGVSATFMAPDQTVKKDK